MMVNEFGKSIEIEQRQMKNDEKTRIKIKRRRKIKIKQSRLGRQMFKWNKKKKGEFRGKFEDSRYNKSE